MKPGLFNLDLYRGDSYSWQFQLFEDIGGTIPVDLTGATSKAEIRDESGGAVVVLLQTTIIGLNAIQLDLPAPLSATVPATGVWDLQITYPDAQVRTVVAGSVKVTGDVTDSVAGLASATGAAPPPRLRVPK